jgi:2-phosphosulfolactate phosphatase
MPAVSRIVLPSPNGSTLTLLAADSSVVFCGCLRNARVVAEAYAGYDSVGVVPAGERWPNRTSRPSLEDWLGAGAVISHLSGSWSPEAKAAAAAFHDQEEDLLGALNACPSGIELIGKGYGRDVETASQYDSSITVPRFTPPAYRG